MMKNSKEPKIGNLCQLIMKERFPLEVWGCEHFVNIQIIAALIDLGVIKNRATFSAYDIFTRVCIERDIEPISHIAFSKFITRNFNIYIEDRRRGQFKYRVFREGSKSKKLKSKEKQGLKG